MSIRNFGRNLELLPQHVLTPANEEELLEILRQHRGQNIRAIGRLHSWSEAIVAEEVLLDLRQLNDVRVERRGEEVYAVVGGGCQIKRLLSELERLAGVTLPTLGLISEQTIAGATATGTHGSGRHSLSHYLDEVRIAAYDAAGEPIIRTISGGDELRAARCSLGCLGIVVSVALRCRPQYRIEEHFREYDKLEDVLAAESEFPLTQFYLIPWRWKWMAQHRRESTAPRSWLAPLYRLYWYLCIDVSLHLMILLLVRWLGIPLLVKSFYRWIVPLAIVRPWRVVDRSQDMLVMEHELFRHLEIEIFVHRSRLAAATDYLQQVLQYFGGEAVPLPLGGGRHEGSGPHPNPLPQGEGAAGSYLHHYAICIRKVLPDDTLISMTSGSEEPHYAISLITYARPSERAGFFHCAEFLAHGMAAQVGGRPHWGKFCPLDASEVQRLYPQLPQYVEICRRHDPAGVFRNRWLSDVLFQPPLADRQTAQSHADATG
jgi:FAD/FMN-containing dehydrogenase